MNGNRFNSGHREGGQVIKLQQKPELAARFGWWWKQPGKAMMRLYKESPYYFYKSPQVIIPPGVKGPLGIWDFKPEWLKRPKRLKPEQLEMFCLDWYVNHYSECAFWYELHARRALASEAKDGVVDYQFGLPFHKLTSEQIRLLAIHWKSAAPKKPHAYTVTDTNDIADSKIITHLTKLAQSGWSAPRLISFNFRECSNSEILNRLKAFLKIERSYLDIPEPRVNAGKKLRIAKAGRAFTVIEALDVWTRLPTAEAKITNYDDADSRRAKRLIKKHFKENNLL